MRRGNRTFELDMTHGKLIPKVAAFAVPLMATSILQLLYNAADVIVVGRFTGPEALAAVGSTGALINLIINVFLGLSVGTNVVAANYYGANDFNNAQETVHTSISISVIGGVLLGIVGVIFAGTFLEWMGSPEEVLPLATVYVRIYFAGMPVNMLYNFGAAVLRAVGDTRRPLYFLTVAGLVNVVLNLVFVIAFHMGVAGVALATIISQLISAVLVVQCLMRSPGFVHLDPKKLRISGEKLRAIARIGLPAGCQGACFSLSNVLIQSTINGYGAIVVAGNSASSNIEGFIYAAMNSFHQAAVTFTSANVGARKNSRIRKTLGACATLVTAVGASLGIFAVLTRRFLVGIYSPDAEVVAAALPRLTMFGLSYWLCGLMDVLSGVLRGMGATILPMTVSILGACGFRIFWIYVILPIAPSLMLLYLSYPASWILTGGVHLICYLKLLRRFPASPDEEREELSA